MGRAGRSPSRVAIAGAPPSPGSTIDAVAVHAHAGGVVSGCRPSPPTAAPVGTSTDVNEKASRSDPQILLRRTEAEEQGGSRAKLKVFFGFAPGVGKTYAMLEAARLLAVKGA